MKSAIVLITVIVIGAAVALFTPVGNIVLQQMQSLLSPPKQTVIVTAHDAATTIAKFIQKAQQADGSLLARYRCVDATCVGQPDDGSSSIGYAVAALLVASEQTGDTSLRSAADNAIARILRLCENDVSVCERNFFALHEYYVRTSDELYRDALMSSADYIVTSIRNSPVEISASRNMGKKLVLLSEISGRTRYINTLSAMADRALTKIEEETTLGEPLYSAASMPVSMEIVNLISDILVPAYAVSAEQRYLEAAGGFFKRAELPSNLPRFGWESGMAAVLRAAEALDTLARADGVLPVDKETFAAQARNIMTGIVIWQYDTRGRELYDGDGSLVTGVRSSNELGGINYKSINSNGFAALLLFDVLPSEHSILLTR